MQAIKIQALEWKACGGRRRTRRGGVIEAPRDNRCKTRSWRRKRSVKGRGSGEVNKVEVRNKGPRPEIQTVVHLCRKRLMKRSSNKSEKSKEINRPGRPTSLRGCGPKPLFDHFRGRKGNAHSTRIVYARASDSIARKRRVAKQTIARRPATRPNKPEIDGYCARHFSPGVRARHNGRRRGRDRETESRAESERRIAAYGQWYLLRRQRDVTERELAS
jgi:hypothetical protein